MNSNISISAGDDSIAAAGSSTSTVDSSVTGSGITGGGNNPVAWGVSAVQGFAFVNPLLWPMQIALIIIFVIIFIGMFGMETYHGMFGAYLAQGLIIMFLSEWILDKLIKLGKK